MGVLKFEVFKCAKQVEKNLELNICHYSLHKIVIAFSNYALLFIQKFV